MAHPFKFDDVKDALKGAGVQDITVTEVDQVLRIRTGELDRDAI